MFHHYQPERISPTHSKQFLKTNKVMAHLHWVASMCLNWNSHILYSLCPAPKPACSSERMPSVWLHLNSFPITMNNYTGVFYYWHDALNLWFCSCCISADFVSLDEVLKFCRLLLCPCMHSPISQTKVFFVYCYAHSPISQTHCKSCGVHQQLVRMERNMLGPTDHICGNHFIQCGTNIGIL